MRSNLVGYIILSIIGLVAFVLVPLRYGSDHFNTFALYLALSSYVALFDFGAFRSYQIFKVSRRHSRVLDLTGLCFFTILSFFLAGTMLLFHSLIGDPSASFYHALYWSIFNVPLNIMSLFLVIKWDSSGQFTVSNSFKIIQTFCQMVAPLYFLEFEEYILCGLILKFLLMLPIYVIFIQKLNISKRALGLVELKKFVSIHFFTQGFLGQSFLTLDKIISSYNFTGVTLSLYLFGSEFGARSIQVCGQASKTSLPRLGRAISNGNKPLIYSEFKLALTYTLGILVVILSTLFILHLNDVNYYYPDIPLDLSLLCIFAFGAFLNGLSAILTNVCTFLKMHKLVSQVQIIQLVPYIIALLLADSPKAMALIWATRNALDLFCLCLALFRKRAKIWSLNG